MAKLSESVLRCFCDKQRWCGVVLNGMSPSVHRWGVQMLQMLSCGSIIIIVIILQNNSKISPGCLTTAVEVVREGAFAQKVGASLLEGLKVVNFLQEPQSIRLQRVEVQHLEVVPEASRDLSLMRNTNRYCVDVVAMVIVEVYKLLRARMQYVC